VYFGAVTTLILEPDNLKTGITKHNRHESVVNKMYQELAEDYRIAACHQGYSDRFFRLPRLLVELQIGKGNGSWEKHFPT